MFSVLNKLGCGFVSVALMLASVRIAGAAEAVERIDGPAATFTATNQLQPIEVDLQQNNYASAGARLDSLFRDHGDELMDADGSSRLLAVSQWAASALASGGTGLLNEYRRQFDQPAQQMLAAARENSGYRPEELYAVARDYPCSSAAPQALVLAADRALDLGDIPSATTFYEMAIKAGWTPDESRARRFATLDTRATPNSPARATMKPLESFLPMQASWYGRPEGYAALKPMAFTTGGVTYLSGERATAAMGEGGTVLWNWMCPQPWEQGMLIPRATGRGPIFEPAVLSDLTGAAKIIVTASPQSRNSERCLRALRASDGRLLWSSEEDETFAQTVFLGPATVCGRYVYVMAATAITGGASLELVAIETSTGRLLWQVSLATISTTQHGHNGHGDQNLIFTAAELWQQGRPIVAGDSVYVSPNAGWAYAVERFDGHIRWATPYGNQVQRTANGARPVVPTALRMRYSNTPGVTDRFVVVAAQDDVTVYGFDADSGKLLWQNHDANEMTLVGASNGVAVLADAASVHGIACVDGSRKWDSEINGGVNGPSALTGKVCLIPSGNALRAISVADGSPVSLPFVVPDVLKLPESQTWKSMFSPVGREKPVKQPGPKSKQAPAKE